MAILRYPTGVYASLLPNKPSDLASVLYIISYLEPPRSKQQTGKVNNLKKYNNVSVPLNTIRFGAGQMVCQVLIDGDALIGGSNQLVMGQVLEFDNQISTTIEPVTQVIETTHNDYVGDLAKYGIVNNSAVIDAVIDAQRSAMADIETKRNRKLQVASELSVIETEKSEINRAISSIQAAISTGGSSVLQGALDHLNTSIVSRNSRATVLLAESVVLDQQISALEDSIKAASYLVR